MRYLRYASSLFFMFIALFIIIPINIPLGHAVIPIFVASTEKDCSPPTNPCSAPSINTNAGDRLMVTVVCWGQALPTLGDSLNTVYTNIVTISNAFPSVWSGTSSGGADIVSLTGSCISSLGEHIAVDVYRFVTGLGVNNQDSSTQSCNPCPDSLTMIIQPNSFIYEVYAVGNSGATCATISGSSGQTVRDTFSCDALGGTRNVASTMDRQYANGGSTISTATTGAMAGSSQLGHITVELLASGGSVTQVSNCYGNCGTPAVTRANTNSTKSINFNITQTWFYENQVIFPALILNESASMGCSVSTAQCPRQNSITLGFWATQTNCIGAIPFSTSCPAILVTSTVFSNPQKGLVTMQVNYPVFTGQWIAIGFTAQQQQITINDTNTAVNIFNTINFPASITNTAPQGTSKANVYAWATGNTITGGGIIPSPTICSTTDLACFEVQAICNLSPSNCMVGALVYLLIYWFVFFLSSNIVVAYVDRETGMHIPLHPSLYVLVFVVIMAMETVLGVLPGWFTLLEFLIVSVLFGSFLSSMFSSSSHRGSRE